MVNSQFSSNEHGPRRLVEVGHLALLWRSDRGGRWWMCCGAVKDVEITEQMRRKTELCHLAMANLRV